MLPTALVFPSPSRPMTGSSPERRHFRVTYPTTLRPVIEIDGVECEVVNVSEGGVLFRGALRIPPQPDDEIEGTIRFRGGEVVPVRGRIVRVDRGEIALVLDAGVPFRVIMDEQKFLLRDNRRLVW